MSLHTDVTDVFGDAPVKDDGLPDGYHWQERTGALTKKQVWRLLSYCRKMKKNFESTEHHGEAALCDVFLSWLQDPPK